MDVWEDTDGTCSAFEFLIDALNHVGGAHFGPVLVRQIKNTKSLGDFYFQLCCELRSALGKGLHHTLQEQESRGFVRSIEDGSQLLKYEGTRSSLGT
jgi:hypothetical protein